MAIGNPITLTDNVASKIVSTTATADQTLFTVSGGYRVNQIAVFRNGIRLVTGNDFIARDGSTVTLSTAANDGDSIEFQIFDDFRVSDAIVATASTQTLSGDLSATGTIYGAAIGIQSGGTHIGIAQTLNFVGSGNTFSVTGQTIDVSLSGGGGGGGGLGTAINFSDESTASPFSYIDAEATVTEDMFLGTSKAGGNNSYIVTVVPNIEISSGAAVTVGTGKTMIIDVLQIGDL